MGGVFKHCLAEKVWKFVVKLNNVQLQNNKYWQWMNSSVPLHEANPNQLLLTAHCQYYCHSTTPTFPALGSADSLRFIIIVVVVVVDFGWPAAFLCMLRRCAVTGTQAPASTHFSACRLLRHLRTVIIVYWRTVFLLPSFVFDLHNWTDSSSIHHLCRRYWRSTVTTQLQLDGCIVWNA